MWTCQEPLSWPGEPKRALKEQQRPALQPEPQGGLCLLQLCVPPLLPHHIAATSTTNRGSTENLVRTTVGSSSTAEKTAVTEPEALPGEDALHPTGTLNQTPPMLPPPGSGELGVNLAETCTTSAQVLGPPGLRNRDVTSRDCLCSACYICFNHILRHLLGCN